MSADVRTMTPEERATADYALRWSRIESPDDALDRISEWANRCESRSLKAEERGLHADATSWQQAAEFADVLVVLVS